MDYDALVLEAPGGEGLRQRDRLADPR